MLSKEEIEKAKERVSNLGKSIQANCKEKSNMATSIETFLQYTQELEQENKDLKKGQTSLMSSRKKWKDRYYNLKAKNKEDIEEWESVLDCAKFEINKLEQENNKQSKIIGEMAEYLAIIRDCPNEDKGANLDCENRCSNDDSLYAECWKQYFEKKVDEK